MVSFFIRLCIASIGIFGASFFAVLSQASCGALVFFLCIWVSVCGFEKLFWWIVAVAFFYSVMQYDIFAVYFFGIVAAVYFFDVIATYAMHGQQENAVLYYILVSVISLFTTLCVRLLHHNYGGVHAENILMIVVFSVVVFFCMRWIVLRMEKYITFYTRSIDVKCHT